MSFISSETDDCDTKASMVLSKVQCFFASVNIYTISSRAFLISSGVHPCNHSVQNSASPVIFQSADLKRAFIRSFLIDLIYVCQLSLYTK